MPATWHTLLVLRTQSIFDSASPQAESIKSITNGFLIAASAVFLLVVILTVYTTIKFRAKKDDSEPSQTTGSGRLEIVLVSMSLALVTFFFFWSLTSMREVLPPAGNHPPDAIITGHQWWWQATYPGTGVTTANEIHLPVGKKILLQLKSSDVIHDWWVPSLSGKMDMIPGTVNYLWMTITKAGIYEGSCAEFCGQQHAWMRIRVIAQSTDDYNYWLNVSAKNAMHPVDTLAKAGEALFMKASCSGCHSIRGTTANGSEGPDLTHFGNRETMLTGLMLNNSSNVNEWLSDPQKVKPGAHMPRFIFQKDSILALTAYLEQLK